jgi:hypothetical protein
MPRMSSVKVQTIETMISTVSQRGFSAMLRLGGSFSLTAKFVTDLPAVRLRQLPPECISLE